MNILVVNDDGYQSKNLSVLADAFKKYGEVYIVAPHYEQSAASSSITVRNGLVVHNHDQNIWSVEGTPSDCIKFALYGLKLKVDLVVSGINNGHNLGLDTIYSGTVGACMEALMVGKRAIAFSNDYNVEVNQSDLEEVIGFVLKNEIYSDQYILNINFPKINSSKGIVITDLDIKAMEQYYEQKDGTFFPKRIFKTHNSKENTDLWAFENGYTSITPLKLGNGDSTLTQGLKDKIGC